MHGLASLVSTCRADRFLIVSGRMVGRVEMPGHGTSSVLSIPGVDMLSEPPQRFCVWVQVMSRKWLNSEIFARKESVVNRLCL